MPGSLCSLGLSVNIQPLTSWFESHLDIINVLVQDMLLYE